jgi:cytidylate kinase
MPNLHDQLVISVDGTMASGKTTLSKNLARQYGAKLLEYSLFFRLIAQHMNDLGFTPELQREPSPEEINEALGFAKSINWDMISACGSDPTINSHEVSQTAPYFSGIKEILDVTDNQFIALIDSVRDRPVIASGRTVGKYVYPNADVKLYVDASLDSRSQRCAASNRETKGRTVNTWAGILQAADGRDQMRTYQPTIFDPTVHTRIDTSNNTKESTMLQATQVAEQIQPSLSAIAQARYIG